VTTPEESPVAVDPSISVPPLGAVTVSSPPCDAVFVALEFPGFDEEPCTEVLVVSLIVLDALIPAGPYLL
jgi:hypothetical protein